MAAATNTPPLTRRRAKEVDESHQRLADLARAISCDNVYTLRHGNVPSIRSLLASDPSSVAYVRTKEDAFVYAFRSGEVGRMRVLLEFSHLDDTREGRSLLKLAIRLGDRDFVIELVRAGASTVLEDQLLHTAIEWDDVELLRICLASPTVNQNKKHFAFRDRGHSPAWHAILLKRIDCLRLCMDCGATREPILLQDAIAVRSPECVDVLLAAGVACTPRLLGIAIYAGHVATVRSILEHGVVHDPSSIYTHNLPLSHDMVITLSSHITDSRAYEFTDNREICVFLEDTAFWSSKLHFFQYHPAAYVRSLLRSGADPLAMDISSDKVPSGRALFMQRRRGDTDLYTYKNLQSRPTPLSLALSHPHLPNAEMIIRSNVWSPKSHDLFPDDLRKRARELLHVGALLSYQPRFATCQRAIADVWLLVIRFALSR